MHEKTESNTHPETDYGEAKKLPQYIAALSGKIIFFSSTNSFKK